MQIWLIIDLVEKLKLNCLLKTLVFWLFKNKLVVLLISTIVSGAKVQSTRQKLLLSTKHIFGYTDEESNLNTIIEIPRWEA